MKKNINHINKKVSFNEKETNKAEIKETESLSQVDKPIRLNLSKIRRKALNFKDSFSAPNTTSIVDDQLQLHDNSTERHMNKFFDQASLSDFDINQDKELGTGKFGRIQLAWWETHKISVAIKRLDKQEMQRNRMQEQLQREIALHQSLSRVPTVLPLQAVLSDDKQVQMVLELANKKSLFHVLMGKFKRTKQAFSEKEAAWITQQMLNTLKQLRTAGVMHRDIKLENIMVFEGKNGWNVKLSDFGWGCQSREMALESKGLSKEDVYWSQVRSNLGLDVSKTQVEPRKTFCGTDDQLAPDMLIDNDGYGDYIDIWALGILAQECLHGYPPQNPTCETDRKYIWDKIKNGEFKECSSALSEEASHFIKSIVTSHTEERPTIDLLLAHPWIKKFDFGNGAKWWKLYWRYYEEQIDAVCYQKHTTLLD